MGLATRSRCSSVWLLAAVSLLVACFERGGGDKAEVERRQPPRASSIWAPPAVARLVDAAAGTRARPDATIRIRLATEPVHLNPFIAGEAVVNRVSLGDIYEGLLCERALNLPPVPCLATSVSSSADGKKWTFVIRSGVRWHDGRRFGPADVVFSFGLLRNKKVVTWLRGDFGDIAEVTSAGDRVTIGFTSFRPGRRAAFARIPILPKHVFASAGHGLRAAAANRQPVGTGPLRLVAWKSGESLTLERYDGYWGSKPRLKRIVYRIMPNRRRALQALAAGKLDLVTELPIDEALAFKKRHGSLQLFSYARQAYLAAVHNLRKLRDPQLRRALTHSLDRAGVIKTMFHGYADRISGPFPLGSAAYDPNTAPLAFDRKAAAAMVRRSVRKPRKTIELLVPVESRTMRRIADVWVEDAKPHLRLKVVLAPYTTVLSRARAGEFDVALLAFTSSADLDMFTRLHSSQAGRENYGAVRDKKLDALIDALRVTADAGARRDIQRAIHRRIHVLQPYTFIASDRRLGLARRGISGIRAGAYGPQARALWRTR